MKKLVNGCPMISNFALALLNDLKFRSCFLAFPAFKGEGNRAVELISGSIWTEQTSGTHQLRACMAAHLMPTAWRSSLLHFLIIFETRSTQHVACSARLVVGASWGVFRVLWWGRLFFFCVSQVRRVVRGGPSGNFPNRHPLSRCY